MGRHAVPRSRTVLSLVIAGTVTALGAGVLAINGAATAAPKLSDNLVANPDFEQGTAGWNTQSTKTKLSIGVGHDSKQSGTVTALSGGQSLLLNDSPNVIKSATKAAQYLGTVWVRSDSRMAVTLRFREVNRSGGYVGGSQASGVLSSTGWVQLKAGYVAKGDGDQIAVQVLTGAVAKGASVSVDDVDVRQVLTPTESGSAKSAVVKPSASATPKASESKSPEAKQSPTPTASSEAPKQSEQASQPAASSSDTLFGAAMWMNSGETWAQTLSRLEGKYGHLDVVRAYYSGLPGAWTSGVLGATGNRPVNVSFKALPQDILAGKDDAALKQWFASAPTDRKIWWTYYHEPEDNIKNGEFTAADYRAAWRHIVDIARQSGPSNLKATLVLMDWSLNPASGRTWTDYYPGADYIDVLGWDSYNGHGVNPKQYYNPEWNIGTAISVSKAAGKPFAFAEWGSELVAGDSGSQRAAWMKDMARYMAQQGAVFATYFDCPVVAEYRLLDQPSENALRDVMDGEY